MGDFSDTCKELIDLASRSRKFGNYFSTNAHDIEYGAPINTKGIKHPRNSRTSLNFGTVVPAIFDWKHLLHFKKMRLAAWSVAEAFAMLRG